MAVEQISNTLIANLAAKGKLYEIRDSRLRGFMVRVFKGGAMSYAVEYERGKKVTLAKVGSITPKQARERAAKVLGDYAAGIDPKHAEAERSSIPTLQQFIEDEYGPWVRTHNASGGEAIKTIYRHFQDLLNTPLDEIKAKNIDKWRTKKLEQGVMKVNTVNRTVTPLRSAITKAVEWGIIKEHGLAGLKILKYDDTRIRYLEDDERKRLFAVLKAREDKMKDQRANANAWRKERGYALYPERRQQDYADHLLPMVLLALHTGVRKGELLSLKRKHINLIKGTLFVAKSKNYLARYLPLNKVAIDMLTIWMQQTEEIGSEYLFPTPKDPNKPIKSIKSAWSKVLDDAKIKDFRWHDLRHDFASNLVMKDVSLYVVQKLLGHNKIDQTMNYAHLAPDFIAESVKCLE